MINYSDSLRRRLEELAPKTDIAIALLDPEYTDSRQGDYVTMRPNGMASYLPRGRALEYVTQNNGVERWAKDGRQECRPGRLFRQLLKPTIADQLTDAQWDQFVALLTYVALEGEIGLVHGTDIAYWYDSDHYAPRSGSLNSSCMQYDTARARFYAINPDTIAMLTLIDGELLRARAIVWQTDIGPFMDRIYGNPNAHAAFIAHAEREGWWHYGNSGYMAHPDHPNNAQFQAMRCPIASFDVNEMPYRDTMVYEYSHPTKMVTNMSLDQDARAVHLATKTWTQDTPIEVNPNDPLINQTYIDHDMEGMRLDYDNDDDWP